jgi:muconolactone delta-isomerase
VTYLAISTNTGDPSSLFEAEGARMAELVSSGAVEHVWLKADWSGAVLVLASDDEEEARALVDSLPIARAGLTRFDLTPVLGPPPAPSDPAAPSAARPASHIAVV